MRTSVALALASVTVIALHAQAVVPAFEALVLLGRQQLAETTSVRAAFVETTYSSLLLEPVVSSGTVLVVEPGRMVIRYTGKEPRTVIVDDGRLVVHWPSRGETETIDIVETQTRVRRYFVDASAAELRRLFRVEVSRDSETPGTYLITMIPTRRQIRDSLAELRIWVPHDGSFMARLRMDYANGDSRDFRFDDVEFNVPVDEALFAVPGH